MTPCDPHVTMYFTLANKHLWSHKLLFFSHFSYSVRWFLLSSILVIDKCKNYFSSVHYHLMPLLVKPIKLSSATWPQSLRNTRAATSHMKMALAYCHSMPLLLKTHPSTYLWICHLHIACWCERCYEWIKTSKSLLSPIAYPKLIHVYMNLSLRVWLCAQMYT